MNRRTVHKGFWQLADPKIWIASTMPMLLAASLAFLVRPETFDWRWFFLAILAVYLIEIGKNALNEYVDFRSGVDPAVDAEHRTPFSGGKKTIVDGLLTPGQTLWIAGLTFSAAAAIGLLMVWQRSVHLIYFGIAGIGLAILYSLPPFKLAYRGWGEITVGFVFGPLLIAGMYWLMALRLDPAPLLLSLTPGAQIAAVLVINEFPDYEADRDGNKRNWVVRLGKQKSVGLYAALFAVSYFTLILSAIITGSWFWLLGLLSAPIAVRAIRVAARHYNDIRQLTQANAMTVQAYILTDLLLVIGVIADAVLRA